MAFKMKGNPIKLGGMATKAVAKMKEPMKMKSPMELKEKSPAELEEKSAMKMGHKSPAELEKKSPAELESPAKDYSTERGSHDHPHSATKMKSPMEAGHKDSPMDAGHEDSPMEAGHEDSPMEAGHEESPAKKIKYFGRQASGSETTEVMNHNKKYHTDPKREGNKLSNEVVKPGHTDH